MRTTAAICIVLTFGVGVLAASASATQDEPKPRIKTPLHDVMEEVEDLWGMVKKARKDEALYEEAAKNVAKMRPLLQKSLKMLPESLEKLGLAKDPTDVLEAQAFMTEALAHAYGLEAAFLRKDADQIKERLIKLNAMKNAGHDKFAL